MREALLQELRESDADMIRVVEDLVEAMLRHAVIKPSELAEATRAKLERRRQLRAELNKPETCPECGGRFQINGRFRMCIKYGCPAYGILIG